MVFANFSQDDKEAFFELLDEYFESRSHLFGGGSAPPRQPRQPVQQQQPKQEQVIALYDYNGVGLVYSNGLSNSQSNRLPVKIYPSDQGTEWLLWISQAQTGGIVV